MPKSDRLIGVQAVFLYDGTEIPITKMRPRVHKTYQDVTSSLWYDSNYGLVFPVKQENTVYAEVDIEGIFRYSVIPSPILVDLFSDSVEVECYVGLDFINPLFHGYFHIEEFEMSMPHDDVCTYSCRFIPHGTIRPIN